jgi:hypothetical protein
MYTVFIMPANIGMDIINIKNTEKSTLCLIKNFVILGCPILHLFSYCKNSPRKWCKIITLIFHTKPKYSYNILIMRMRVCTEAIFLDSSTAD